MSILTIAFTATLAFSGIGVPVSAPVSAPSSVVVLTPELGSQSPSAVPPLLTPTRTLASAPAASTAPATSPPETRVKRISAIHIARPPKTVTTVTETVVVAPAEEEREAVSDARREEPRRAEAVCLPPEGNYDGVEPYVGIVGAHIQDKFGVTDVKGKADRGNASEHPKGLALDFMTNTGNVDGDKIAEYLLDRSEDFGVMYVIWQQTLFVPGQDPQEMEDRGDDTANHRDHVHVSFHDEPGSVTPTC